MAPAPRLMTVDDYLHQDDRTIAVERFEGRRVSGRTTYREDEPIASAVLPDFRLSFEEIMEARA